MHNRPALNHTRLSLVCCAGTPLHPLKFCLYCTFGGVVKEVSWYGAVVAQLVALSAATVAISAITLVAACHLTLHGTVNSEK